MCNGRAGNGERRVGSRELNRRRVHTRPATPWAAGTQSCALALDVMSVKRALGECNGAWDACAPAPAPGKRAKPHEQTGVQCSGMKKAEVLDHVDGSVHMQQVLSVQVGGQTKLFGQNGLLLEPWRREGDRTIYRSMSLSFDECFGQ